MSESTEGAADVEQTLSARGIQAVLGERPPRRGRLLLRASVLPALKRYPSSWAVFAILDVRQLVTHHVGIRTQWDRDVDRELLQSTTAEPTIQRRGLRLPDAIAATVLADLSAVRVPIPPGKHPRGTDGTRYRLQLGESFATATFEWWEAGPPAWRALTECFHRHWTTLDGLPAAD